MKNLAALPDQEMLYRRPLSQWDSISVADVINGLSEDQSLRSAVQPLGGLSTISVMRMPSTRVSDSTLLLNVSNRNSDVVGILHVSQCCDAEQVNDGYLNAQAISKKLEYPLNRPVLLPLWMGRVDGRSCSFTELKKPTSSGLLWKYQKRRMRRPVLQWLYASTEKTARDLGDQNELDQLMKNLDFFEGRTGFSKDLEKMAGQARNSLLQGLWVPRHTADHNDMWKGNITLDNAYGEYDKFYLIDWGAANVDGYGIHDFLTFSKSFGVSHSTMRYWLFRYAALFQGGPEALVYQYLAGMGHLGRNLNNFPYDRYVQKVSYDFMLLKTLLKIE